MNQHNKPQRVNWSRYVDPGQSVREWLRWIVSGTMAGVLPFKE